MHSADGIGEVTDDGKSPAPVEDPLVALLSQPSPQRGPSERGLIAGATRPRAAAEVPMKPFDELQSPLEDVTLESLMKQGLVITVVPDALYFCSVSGHPLSTESVRFFSTEYHLQYTPYFADFGPLNIACLVRFCRALASQLKRCAPLKQKIVYYSGHGGHQRANAGYLIACFGVLSLGLSAMEVYHLFASVYPPFLPFRDASYGVSTFNLTLLDCLQAVEKARILGWIDLGAFDVEEYHTYDAVENGDWNWIVPRQFIAFSSPVDGVPGREATHVAKAFRDRKVRLVLRLNESLYDRRSFTTLGLQHVDMVFPDGSSPSDRVAARCVQLMERAILVDGGAVAVHCKAGLGRTGTVICLYLMKHYGFSCREAIAWCRICRPGCVIGQQQQYLERVEARMNRGPLHAVTLRVAAPANPLRSPGSAATTVVAATPVPAVVMSTIAVKRPPKNAFNGAAASHERLIHATSAAELLRQRVEAKAQLYDASFRSQDEIMSQYKFSSSKSDALRSACSPTLRALTISDKTSTRRLLGERSGGGASRSSSSQLTRTTATTPLPDRSTGDINALAVPRASSQMSNSAIGTVQSIDACMRQTLRPIPTATVLGAVDCVLHDMGVPRPSRAGSSGPGWLRPMEHLTSTSEALF